MRTITIMASRAIETGDLSPRLHLERAGKTPRPTTQSSTPTANDLADALNALLTILNVDKDGSFFICEEGADIVKHARTLLVKHVNHSKTRRAHT